MERNNLQANAQAAAVDVSLTPETERTEQQRPPRRERNERRERQPRNTEQAHAPKAELNAETVQEAINDAIGAEVVQDASTEEAPRNGRRSRDRYGRDRRNGRERNSAARDDEATTQPALEAAAESPAPLTTAPESAAPTAAEAAVEAPRRSYFNQVAAAAPTEAAVANAVTADAPVEPAAITTETAPVQAEVAPAIAETAVMTAEAAPEAAPATAADTRTPAMQAASYVLPVDALQQLARDADLEWVNSDADKIAAVQAAIAAEPKPVHVPRERQPVVVVDEGPLVLVETRKDLSAMVLPFEQTTNA